LLAITAAPLLWQRRCVFLWKWIFLMLRLALFFLVVSIVAAIFGFGGVAAASADIARILFFIAIVVFVVLLVAGLMAGSTLW
jgi:uncharacterized membrane protein YtjA (UPF0391 family)